MKVYTTAPLEDPRDAREGFRLLEEIGYDGAFSFEAKHDPFLPLVLAAEHTKSLKLGTAIAIAFARNPMNLANLAYGLQAISSGRFTLGLGSQVKPHIEKRFSMPWSRPAARSVAASCCRIRRGFPSKRSNSWHRLLRAGVKLW